MNTFVDIVRVRHLSGQAAGFYSVRRRGNYLYDEFTNWQLSHKSFTKVKDEYDDILNWLLMFGQTIGTKKEYFRPEKEADALPPPVEFLTINYQTHLRLYCLRLSDQVTILFNGGIKDSRAAQDSSVQGHFLLANAIALEIKELMTTGVLQQTQTELICTDGSIPIYE